jgi:hypothetical protein
MGVELIASIGEGIAGVGLLATSAAKKEVTLI